MTIAVGILSAVLGIVIGILMMRVKGAQRDAECRQSSAELETQVAVLQSQLNAEMEKLHAARETAENQLAEVKAEAEKRIADEKDAAAKRLAAEKEEAEKRIAEERSRAEMRLADEKMAAEKRLETEKQELERVHQNAFNEQKERFDDISKRLVAEAKSATEEMLKQRQKDIAESGHATMEQLVNPLKETIAKMEQTMKDSTLKQVETNTSLKDALSQAIDSNAKTKQTADDLIRAFKHDSKIQGDWGECVLEELLASLGLQEGTHFEMQAPLRDQNGNLLVSEESGRSMRPDVIVHLDTKKDVIVDSKVSMAAFFEYNRAEDPEVRKDWLKKHIQSLEQHVKELSGKKYENYVKAPRETIDFVIMFVPRADALWRALAEKPSLWREAMEKGVYIADEQTLYAALRIIKLTWRQVQQAQNQQKVFELANEMLKRVGMFVKQMGDVGKALDNAQKAYQNGMSKFAEKGQSVLTTCRQLESLGAKQDKNNPLPTEIEVIEMQGNPAQN